MFHYLATSFLGSRNLPPKRDLGSSLFARHYLGNKRCFLFLQLLRCFTSLSSLRTVNIPPKGGNLAARQSNGLGFPIRRSPADNALCQLTEAYRRLTRPSSAFCPKASIICLELFSRPIFYPDFKVPFDSLRSLRVNLFTPNEVRWWTRGESNP